MATEAARASEAAVTLAGQAGAQPAPAARSGPLVALLFQRLLGLQLVFAFGSLAAQVPVLIGSRGLLPAAELFARARAQGASFSDLPALFWLGQSDALLVGLAWFGAALGLCALLGLWPRVCFALAAPLYLSYATTASEFTAFQWDNLLVECTLLALLLPADRRAPLAHFAFRVLLFKLYFESGIAKWQSGLHDWQDGSAMVFYYETAPLPAALAFYAHRLPEALQHLSSWGALVLELALPLLIFGPRPARLIAFAAFTGFQLLNTATANYGFFTYLSASLHVFLLADRDVAPLLARLRIAAPASAAAAPHAGKPRRVLARAAIAGWLLASLATGCVHFARSAQIRDALMPLYDLYTPFRVANAYHLFGQITRERIEPQFETGSGGKFREHDLHYKPGAASRAPPYVAPYQPRVDFRLWFYGLSARRGTPLYVATLLERLCHDPEAVQPLFATRLPRAPEQVRITFYRYHFATLAEHRASGAYWTRERIGSLPARSCR